MPLQLTVSCFSKIQIGFTFTFLVLAHPGSPGQRPVKRVCVYCEVSRGPKVRLLFTKTIGLTVRSVSKSFSPSLGLGIGLLIPLRYYRSARAGRPVARPAKPRIFLLTIGRGPTFDGLVRAMWHSVAYSNMVHHAKVKMMQ